MTPAGVQAARIFCLEDFLRSFVLLAFISSFFWLLHEPGRLLSQARIENAIGQSAGASPAAPSAALPRVADDVARKNLVSKVAPVYPVLARTARVEGAVVLQTTIDKDGRVAAITGIKGNPLLTDGALQAVRQWRYKPVEVNGEPVQVVTTVTINFSLIRPPSVPPGIAVITGRIVHADGTPAVGVPMDVALPSEPDTRPTTFTEDLGEYRIETVALPLLRAYVVTDSSGEYSIGSIGPGSYYIYAMVNAEAFYYPGASRDKAVSVTVKSNQTILVGIDFSIP